jgi:hypothetical protein
MPNLYDEAIADAKSLKEMAERNARNKIIESISPQIRRLVERQILAEKDETEEEVPNMDLDPLPDEMPDEDVADVAVPAAVPQMAPSQPAAPSGAPDAGEEVTHTVTTKTASGTEVKINVRVDKHGDAHASADADAADGDDVSVSLNKESLRALSDMVLDGRKREVPNLRTIRAQFESLKKVSRGLPLTESTNFRSAYSILVKNMHDFRNHVISNGSTLDTKKKFNNIVKEMRDMSTNSRFLRLLGKMEETSRLRKEAKLVFDPADLEGLDDEDFKEKLKGMSFGVEFGEETEGGAEGGDEMPVDVSGGEAPAAPATPPADAAAPPAVSEMYDDEEDEDSMYEELDEMEDESVYEMDDAYEEKVFHVDESMLRRELRRLREAKGKIGKGGIKNAMPSAFGGGKVIELPDELNQLSESDDDSDEEVTKKALEVAKKATNVAKHERTARVEESRINRDLKSKLNESERVNATLREQLEEVNLFNAKLLYVNKLMQNRDLTAKQQRAIVESLDAAKSVREAKLLYTSLTESIKPKSGTVNEGRILGSSSRSTRSASPAASLNESVEVERWAILAGIK